MEEFEKIDWIPNVEDIVDSEFVSEERLQKESAMYKILNGTFHDPFQNIRPPVFKSKPDEACKETQQRRAVDNQKSGEKKRKVGRPRTKNIA